MLFVDDPDFEDVLVEMLRYQLTALEEEGRLISFRSLKEHTDQDLNASELEMAQLLLESQCRFIVSAKWDKGCETSKLLGDALCMPVA